MAASTRGKGQGREQLSAEGHPEKGGQWFPKESIRNGPLRILSPLAGRFPGNGEHEEDQFFRKSHSMQIGKRGRGLSYTQHSDD